MKGSMHSSLPIPSRLFSVQNESITLRELFTKNYFLLSSYLPTARLNIYQYHFFIQRIGLTNSIYFAYSIFRSSLLTFKTAINSDFVLSVYCPIS